MGYFDALTSSYFKTTSDGRRLLFPWGVMGKGYVIPSEPDYQRLQRQFKIYNIVGLVLILGVGATKGFLWSLMPCALMILFYVGWMRFLLRGLQRSDEGLSVNESMASQARAHSGWGLWLMTAGSLVFVIGGIGIMITDPDSRLTAAAATAFFALCLAVFVRLLVLRRRGAETQP